MFHVGLDINTAGQNFNLIAVIGGITVLVAAALAFVQNDIKKVLAYSTVSQLGYMMMGLGIGAWTASVFHIFTHAFFKCCLFLVAGSISHTASHHSFDMKKDMGGLWRKMPLSFGAWMISTAALAGVPLFSGFFSKDEIIDSARFFGYEWFYFVGIIGAFMTTAYMTRATYLTWFGRPRGAAAHYVGVEEHPAHDDDHAHAAAAHGHDDHGDDHGHDDHHVEHGKPFPFAPFDSAWKLTAPIVLLGVLAFGSGYLNAPAFGILWFEHQTESSIGLPFDKGEEKAEGEEKVEEEAFVLDEFATGLDAPATGPLPAAAEGDYKAPGEFKVPLPPKFEWINAAPGLILVALGFIVSVLLSIAVFGGRRNALSFLDGLTERNPVAGGIHRFLVNKLYLDWLYENVIVRAVAYPISKAAYWINQNVIDGIVNGAGRAGKQTGNWVYRNIDQRVVDGAVNASGFAASEGGHALQPVQSGKVSQYGALLFGAATVGALLLIILNV